MRGQLWVFLIPLALVLIGLAAPARAQAGLAPRSEGSGLAAQFPGDLGIEAHPAVVFVEDFEVGATGDLKARWSTLHGPDTLSLSDQSPPGSPGSHSLRMDAKRGENTGGYVYKVLDQGYEKLHMRFYVKFADDHPYSHHFVRMGGRIDAPPYPLGGAGKRPEDHFSVGLDAFNASGNTYPAVGFPPPGVWGFYNYWPEMRSWQSVSGLADPKNPSYFGNGFYPEPALPIPRGEWISVEIMTKLNASPDTLDGEIALWIDGRLVAHYGPGTVMGYWVRDQFRTDPANRQSRPFSGFRWRNRADLLINTVKLENYLEDRAYVWAEEWLQDHPETVVNTERSAVWFDHFVVATEYIGPLVGVGNEGDR